MITETSSFFIKDQCLFGSYPTVQDIEKLESWSVDFIVNLTFSHEKNIVPYSANCKILKFSIKDGNIPEDIIKFCSLIIFLCIQIKDKKRIYIHCKGGHGRAVLVVTCILCYLYKIHPYLALQSVQYFHSKRKLHSTCPNKNKFWKISQFLLTPQQKQFILNLFKTCKIEQSATDQELMNMLLGTVESTYSEELMKKREELYEKFFSE